MAALLTHWRVLIETARRSQDAGSDLGSLIIDTTALQRRLKGLPTPPQTTPAGAVWDTGPLPEIDYQFPGSDISAMAYLGALAPDIPSFQAQHFQEEMSGKQKRQATKAALLSSQRGGWTRLFHARRAGDLVLTLLELISNIPSPALRSQALAFCLGYLSHLATDIALHPWINTVAGTYLAHNRRGTFLSFRPHFYVELCLDEYIAATYFNHERFSWLNQPWGSYIEPVASQLVHASAIPSQVLSLLISAAETTYGLSEKQTSALRDSYLAGLQRLRQYLGGQGTFRWFSLNALWRSRSADPIAPIIASPQGSKETVSLEETLTYAERLSERLCRRAISYYASLRNTRATAEERNQRFLALRNDLRNWNLDTGYALEVSFEQEITLRFLHNWIHFAELWSNEPPEVQRVQAMSR